MCPSLRQVWIFTASYWPTGMSPGQLENKWSCPRSWTSTEPCLQVLEAAHQPSPVGHAEPTLPSLLSPSFSLSPLHLCSDFPNASTFFSPVHSASKSFLVVQTLGNPLAVFHCHLSFSMRNFLTSCHPEQLEGNLSYVSLYIHPFLP